MYISYHYESLTVWQCVTGRTKRGVLLYNMHNDQMFSLQIAVPYKYDDDVIVHIYHEDFHKYILA